MARFHTILTVFGSVLTPLIGWAALAGIGVGIGAAFGWPHGLWVAAAVLMVDLHWPTSARRPS